MEKLQIKKSLEKTKASLIFALIFLILSMPTMIKVLSRSAAISAITICLIAIAVLYRRIVRLSRKINSI
ncbi:MAG: hypothetical protein ACXWQQ_04890 [Pseudobdellovibrio sp.]